MREVAARLDMPLMIGCASNKLLAKIASGMGKGFVRVRSGGEVNFLAPLPVSVLEAVMGKIDKRLGELGIANIGQLSRVSERAMVSQFGPVGSIILKQAQGIDFSQVKAAYPPEIIIAEHAFGSPIEEPTEIEDCFPLLINQAVMKLRKRSMLAGEITLTLYCEKRQILRSAQNDERVAQSDAAVILRRNDEGSASPATASEFVFEFFTFKKPTDSAYSINQALNKLLGTIMRPGMEVSKVQIELSGLTQGESSQLSLIGDSERRSRLNRVTELLIQRFGEDAVFLAASLKPTVDGHLYGNS
jgi:nucleotidyltransferase/DNA polymerase involved in DNA repair